MRLEHVTFGYEPERPVLREVTLEAQPGETIAIVGETGAGKSTLVNLIPRFFDPWEGRVLVDGRDVRDVQLRSPAPAGGAGAAGAVSVSVHRRREHRLRPAGRQPAGNRGRRAHGQRA